MAADPGPSLRIDLKKLLIVLGIAVPILLVDHIYSIEAGQDAYRAAAAGYLETLASGAAAASDAVVENAVARAQTLAARPDVVDLVKRNAAQHRGRDEAWLAAPDKVWQTPEAEPTVDRILSDPVALALREEVGRDPTTIVHLTLADRAGPTAAASLKPTFYFQGDRTWFTVAVGDGRTGAVHVGRPYLDVPTGRRVFEIAVPVVDPDEERVVGALLAAVDAGAFAGLLARALPGETGRAVLTDPEGRPIAAAPAPLAPDADVPELEAVDRESPSGAAWAQVEDGRERLIAFARSGLGERYAEADWTVLVSQDAVEVNEPLRRIANREWISAAVAVLLVMVLAVYFATHRRIDVDPLHDIDGG